MTNADPIVIAAAARTPIGGFQGERQPEDSVRWPPIFPAAALPVARNRRGHFTTLDGPRLSARATTRTLSPASTRATARSRKSIE